MWQLGQGDKNSVNACVNGVWQPGVFMKKQSHWQGQTQTGSSPNDAFTLRIHFTSGRTIEVNRKIRIVGKWSVCPELRRSMVIRKDALLQGLVPVLWTPDLKKFNVITYLFTKCIVRTTIFKTWSQSRSQSKKGFFTT